MLGNVFHRIAALSLTAKVLLAVAALIALGILVVASPLVVFVAALALVVAVLVLIYRVLRRRPLRNWGLIALASLLLVIVFTSISNALYPGPQSEQASSPAEPKEEAAASAPTEATEESATEEDGTKAETTASEPAAETKAKAKNDAATKTANGEPAPATSQPAGAESDGREYDTTVRAVRVVDGDTIEISPAVDGKDEVRLIGVDTPETKDPDCAVQPYGPESSQFATTELQGEEVGLEFDQDREDRYDRLLAYVYKDSEMFNETLLEEGYAQVYTISPNDRYEDRFEEAQDEAQAAERGIWGLSAAEQSELADRGNGIGSSSCTPKTTAPPEPTPAPIPAPAPEPAPEPAPGGGGSTPPLPDGGCPDNAPIKGNRTSSSGELIYHAPGGQFYGRTKAEECFASGSGAEAAGYRASQR